MRRGAQIAHEFLDEIGDLEPELQVKLLHVVEQRTFTPVGSEKPQPFRGRLVCATNRNLVADCKRGRFREDLYWRLSTLKIHVPPLRERMEDVAPIARVIVEGISIGFDYVIDPDALEPLLDHDWPGNVRELDQVMRRAAIWSSGVVIRRRAVAEQMRQIKEAETADRGGNGPNARPTRTTDPGVPRPHAKGPQPKLAGVDVVAAIARFGDPEAVARASGVSVATVYRARTAQLAREA